MESAVLMSESKSDLSILLNLAKKLGIGVKRLSTDDMDDIGLLAAMKKGRTGKYIDTDIFLRKLRSK